MRLIHCVPYLSNAVLYLELTPANFLIKLYAIEGRFPGPDSGDAGNFAPAGWYNDSRYGCMNRRNSLSILRWVALGLIFISVLILGRQLMLYSRMRALLPPGLTIGGVPVGGLNGTEAGERLVRAYGIPIELIYGGSVIQVRPSAVGFSLNIETMLAAADLQRITRNFWLGFMDYMWNNLPVPQPVPLSATISQERLRDYLSNEITPRYDIPAREPIPDPETNRFTAGEPGTSLDIERSIRLIEEALRSPTDRSVILPYNRTSPTQASDQNLQYIVRQIIDDHGFEGVAEFYILDLDTRKEISFAVSGGEPIAPDISFTAASTIKIPIMVYLFLNYDQPLPAALNQALKQMIEVSENGPADSILQSIGGDLAPVAFTDDFLKQLGLKNTFLGGYFYIGAPLLAQYETPANQRTDIDTNPDRYNQTTPAEISMIIDDIYQCAAFDGGTFRAVFGEAIQQSECVKMLEELSTNKTAVLLEAGIPETTRVAHKHGWILETDGLIHGISDAGIVYSPRSTYIFTMFYWSEAQLAFDPTNILAADISGAVYQFFNAAE